MHARRVVRSGPHPVLEIPELVALIFLHLSQSSDLARAARTARRYSDIALRLLWDTPNFAGDPLRNMVVLFPSTIQPLLLPEPDTSLRLPPQAFARFDYYAQFVRHLQVWNFTPDAHIARVLADSRPGLPLFPNVESLHLGADDDSFHMAAPFLSPPLRLVRINHWDAANPATVQISPGVTQTLLVILNLPELERLDLLDTRLPTYERDPVVVEAFRGAAHRLSELFSLDFTTLRPVFDVLSQSPKLTGIFLDLTHDAEGHYPFPEIALLLRHRFAALETLVIQCSGARGIELMEQAPRALKEFDFRVEGEFNPESLRRMTTAMQPSAHTLRVFRCSSSERADYTIGTSIYDALLPLRSMANLRKLIVTLTLYGEDMLKDERIEVLFRAWPALSVCVLECDPEEGTPVDPDTPPSYGLTLQSLITLYRCCPHISELSLPYLDTRVIPALSNAQVTTSLNQLDVRLSRCHAHNRSAIMGFVRAIWPNAEFSFEDCLCPERER